MSKFKVKDLVKIKDQKVAAMWGRLKPENAEALRGALEITFISETTQDVCPLVRYSLTPVSKYINPLEDYQLDEDDLELDIKA